MSFLLHSGIIARYYAWAECEREFTSDWSTMYRSNASCCIVTFAFERGRWQAEACTPRSEENLRARINALRNIFFCKKNTLFLKGLIPNFDHESTITKDAGHSCSKRFALSKSDCEPVSNLSSLCFQQTTRKCVTLCFEAVIIKGGKQIEEKIQKSRNNKQREKRYGLAGGGERVVMIVQLFAKFVFENKTVHFFGENTQLLSHVTEIFRYISKNEKSEFFVTWIEKLKNSWIIFTRVLMTYRARIIFRFTSW